jgi:hypothetical protein
MFNKGNSVNKLAPLVLIFTLLLFVVQTASAQIDYPKQYFYGKQLFREGKYNLAMETFKPLIPYDQRNQFSAYAAFFYALSAYNQNFPAVAKDMLNQVKSLHPTWEKMDEVNYWLGRIHLEGKDFFQGMKTFESIGDKKMEKDITAVKVKALANITDIETVKRLREAYPKDEVIAKTLASLLAKDIANPASRVTLESLINQYHFKRADFIPEAPKTFYKDVYSVSVLLPFMVNTLDPSTTRKKNQIVLDLYEGMKLAADTLDKQGIKISLRAYDTERNADKIKNILATEEVKQTDLIVGPFFAEENKYIQEFAQTQKVNVFNPLSNNSDFIGTNPYAFLYQPSNETLGKRTGEFLATYPLKVKNCIVYYGISKRDSVMAANFVQSATAKGIKVISSNRIAKESVGKIMTMLATPTEFDEFRYPKQFTLKKDSLGSIYVATDDALIYSKVLSGIETRGDSILVVGSENWLEQTAVDVEKFHTLPVVVAGPNATLGTNKMYPLFFKKFIKVHGRVPNTYAKIGYEFMLLMGRQLKENGVYFQEGMNNRAFIPGYLVQGYNFQLSHDNQFVPFVHYKYGKITLVK